MNEPCLFNTSWESFLEGGRGVVVSSFDFDERGRLIFFEILFLLFKLDKRDEEVVDSASAAAGGGGCSGAGDESTLSGRGGALSVGGDLVAGAVPSAPSGRGISGLDLSSSFSPSRSCAGDGLVEVTVISPSANIFILCMTPSLRK